MEEQREHLSVGVAQDQAKNSKKKGRPFPPGVSGNPGGRPKKKRSLLDEINQTFQWKVKGVRGSDGKDFIETMFLKFPEAFRRRIKTLGQGFALRVCIGCLAGEEKFLKILSDNVLRKQVVLLGDQDYPLATSLEVEFVKPGLVEKLLADPEANKLAHNLLVKIADNPSVKAGEGQGD